MNTQIYNNTYFVKQTALAIGFDFCGIAQATPLYDDAKRLEDWLQKGFNGKMQYMENHFDLRINPTKLVPNAKSVITVLKNYYPTEIQNKNHPQIAKYAYGKDYHKVIKKQLKEFLRLLEKKIGKINGRGFVDSAPVLERSWAKQSGLGWIGKNGNLINKKSGSYFFIATFISDLVLQPDAPMLQNYCGSCTQCIDACPTQAILPNNILDATKCISYLTIELRNDNIPQQYKNKFENYFFGCDICQDVCPWNRFSKPNTEAEFTPIKEILQFNLNDWNNMDKKLFEEKFEKSPLKRQGYEGIKRNIKFLLK